VLALNEVMGSALRRRIEDYQKTLAGLTHETHPHKICPLPNRDFSPWPSSTKQKNPARRQRLRIVQSGNLGSLLLRFFIQLFLEAVFEFGADFGNFHSRANQEFAAQQFVVLVLIRQFAGHAAILAILVPAETSVGNGFRADVLETAENRILLGDLERFAKNLDLDQAFVGSKDLIGHARAHCFRYLRLTGL
jgi:hypothetical protein